MKPEEPGLPSSHTKPGYAYTGYQFDVTKVKSSPTLKVRWAGRELFCKNCLCEADNYPYTVIKVALTGRSSLEHGSSQWEVLPGMALWMKAFTHWRHIPDEEAKQVNYVVMLAGDDLTTGLEQQLGSSVGCIPLRNPDRVESIMEEIMFEGIHRGSGFEDNCVHLAHVLLDRVRQDAVHRPKPTNVAKATFERCHRYIVANSTTVGGLTQIAEACDVSVPYLCRLFEQFGETSPYDFLTRQRLERAEMLLVGGKMSIGRIATAVGYNSAGHFTRAFRTRTGMSPSDYRARSRER